MMGRGLGWPAAEASGLCPGLVLEERGSADCTHVAVFIGWCLCEIILKVFLIVPPCWGKGKEGPNPWRAWRPRAFQQGGSSHGVNILSPHSICQAGADPYFGRSKPISGSDKSCALCLLPCLLSSFIAGLVLLGLLHQAANPCVGEQMEC